MRALLLCAAVARLRLTRVGWTPGTCEDNPDYKDAMGYPCEGWEGLNCVEAVESLSWVFDDEDEKEILRNCPKACDACDDLTTTTSTTTAPPEEEGGSWKHHGHHHGGRRRSEAESATGSATAAQNETNATNASNASNDTNDTVEPLEPGWVNVDTRLSNGSVPALPQMPQVGAYVVRGPHWGGGTSDGGAGVVGRVTAVDEIMGTVEVSWPNGRNHSYHLVDEEIAAAKPSAFEPWAPLTEISPAIGAQVRRGPAWSHGDADGGVPGTILDITDGKVTVEWASGLVEEYELLGTELVLRADRTGAEKVLIKVWEDEMSNCDKLLHQEQHVIFEALQRKAVAETDDEKADADKEIEVAEAVIVEAKAMYDLAADHLEAALHEASRHKVAVPGVVQDNSAKRNLTECHGRLSELETVLDELLSPHGDFAVVAIQDNHRGEAGSETIHFHLSPQLEGFGSGVFLQERCETSAQHRQRLARALQLQARQRRIVRPAQDQPTFLARN
jgi:hypothetical protein